MSTDITGIIALDSIFITLPSNVSLIDLTPTIIHNGQSINPQSDQSQNFNNRIIYTVKAEDNSSKNYFIKIDQPVVLNSGTLYITSFDDRITSPGPGRIYGLDLATGKITWSYTSATSGGFTSGVAFASNSLLVVSGSKIISVDTATRLIKWQYKAPKDVNSELTIAGNVVYANCDDGNLYALNVSNGSLLWKMQQEVGDSSSGNTSSPVLSNGIVYFGSKRDGYVYAVDASNGAMKWRNRSPVSMGLGYQSGAAIENGVLVIGDVYRNIVAFNVLDGSVRWTYATSSVIFASPTIAQGLVFTGSADGYMHCLNLIDGALRWKQWAGPQIHASAITDSTNVYFGNAGGSGSKAVFAYDIPTGVRKWAFLSATDIYASTLVFKDKIFAANLTSVFAIDKTTGTSRWLFTPTSSSESFFTSPVLVTQQGQIFYSSQSGHQN